MLAKELDLRYFLENTSFQILFKSFIKTRAHLEIRVELKRFICFKPRPPIDFGVRISFQDFGVNLFISGLSTPHQNLRKMESRCLVMDFGCKLVDIV